jgi:hypothetical protein
VTHALRNEPVPGYHSDRPEHGEIPDPLALESLHQLGPVPAVAVPLPYPSSDHPRTVSSKE